MGHNIDENEIDIKNIDWAPNEASSSDIVVVVPEKEVVETNELDMVAKEVKWRDSTKRKVELEPKKGPIYRYIGESSRSSYERGGEHVKDLKFRRPKSHMLRHCVDKHPNMDPDKVDFRMRVLTSHKSAFERQLREAVLIDHFAGPNLLNSKMEYNRCSIPKMILRVGNEEMKEDTKITKEKALKDKIVLIYKGENKRALDEQTEEDIEVEPLLSNSQELAAKRIKTVDLEGEVPPKSDLNEVKNGPKMKTVKIDVKMAKKE